MEDPLFEAWSKYEDVAMHFNGLLMQFRIQAIGGLATLGTVVGYLAGEKAHTRREGYRLLTGASALFVVAWTGAAALDLVYYRRLLQGAVDAILTLEKASWSTHGQRLLLSHAIEKRVGSGDCAAFWFYGLIELLLLFALAWSWCTYRRIPQSPPGST